MSAYFSYSPGTGFDTHKTLEEARAAAEEELAVFRDEAADGWSEEVTSICYGTVTGQVVESERMPWGEHLERQGQDVEPGDTHPFDEYVDYKLEQPEAEGAA